MQSSRRIKSLQLCLRKKRYPTQKIAEQIARRVEQERGTRLRVYECNTCFGFHLTSKGV